MTNILLERQQGNLLSMTKLNPKVHCNTITLRSEKELKAPLKSEKPKKEDKEVNLEKEEDPPKAQPVLLESLVLVKVPFPRSF